MNSLLYTGVFCLLLFESKARLTTAQTTEEMPNFTFKSRPTNTLSPSRNIRTKPPKSFNMPLKQINSIQTTTSSVALKTTTEISDVTNQLNVGNYPHPDGSSVEFDFNSSSVLPFTVTAERTQEETKSGEHLPFEHNYSSETSPPTVILTDHTRMSGNNRTGSPENERHRDETAFIDFPSPGQITHYNDSSITFVASNKPAESIEVTPWRNSGITHIAQLSPDFKLENHTFFQGSAINENTLPSQGLVHTVLTAYKDHHNLVLSPDDIWTAIMIQFSRLVNANAEKLRHFFVSHEGKKTLTFPITSSSSSGGENGITREDWETAFISIPDILKEATNPNISDFIANNFSTTTDQTRIVSGLTFLNTLQHYYHFEFSILCGIPRITILGNENDWIEIRKRVGFLKTFGDIPSEWSDILAPIIDQFVLVKQNKGKIDGEFWGDIVRIQKNTGCGGHGQADDILDGWLTAFAVFDAEGKWQGEKLSHWKWPRVNMKYIASGVVTVPIQFVKAGLADKVQATIFAGHMGHEFFDDGKTLTPYSGWAVAFQKASKPAAVTQPKKKTSHWLLSLFGW